MAEEKKVAVKKSSAQKRHEQSERRRMRNKAIRSTCRTSAKKFVLAIQKKEQEEAKKALVDLQSEYNSAVSKGVIHKNAAARKSSRMFRLYNKTFNVGAAAESK